MKRVLCVNSAGAERLADANRLRRLGASLHADVVYYDLPRNVSRMRAARQLWHLLQNGGPWDLIYQEGTGIAAGGCLILANWRRRLRYVVSSGDPIGGFFAVTQGWLAGVAFGGYERFLYRGCTAFVGWTPYLAGAALELGAPRAITVEGGVDPALFRPWTAEQKAAARAVFGLPAEALVCGTVGTLKWTARQAYCYGLELVEILKRVRRTDVYVLIVGDGDGRARLEAAIPESLRARAIFTGRLPESEVVTAMNAMDIGFVTQTPDRLGNFRLSTKLPEFLACGVPVAMSPIPGFYDYASGAGWALPASHPTSAEFHARAALWLDDLARETLPAKAEEARRIACERFAYALLAQRFGEFVNSLL